MSWKAKLITLILGGLSFAGCSSLANFDQLTATQSKKEQLLQERLDRFSKAVYWGAVDEAGLYCEPEARSRFIHTLRDRHRDERMVDIEVSDLQFEDDSSEAKVEFQMRYFANTNYLVRKRREQQTWRYDRFNGGWYFHDSVQIEDILSERSGSNPSLSHKAGSPRS